MEMNKDEAEKCKNIAIQLMHKGDLDRAIKFFDKSLQLYPLPGVDRLLQKVKVAKSEKESKSSPHKNFSSAYRRPSHAASTASDDQSDAGSTTSTDSRSFTPQQVAVVKKIKAAGHDHYAVLGISRDADDNDIKKAYKKLALKVHPDKNAAPGAENAFKAVSKAFAILSDADKRAHYDRFGNDDAPQTAHHRHQSGGGSPEEMTPEEIFNMFFGMGGRNQFHPFHPQRRHHYQRPHGQQGEANASNGLGVFLNLIPLLVIVLFMISGSGREELPFSLHRNSVYRVERHTRRASNVVQNIKYFVKDDFQQMYGGNIRAIRQVEERVQQHHIHYLTQHCQNQKHQRNRMIHYARSLHDADQRQNELEKALAYRMPACEELDRMYA